MFVYLSTRDVTTDDAAQNATNTALSLEPAFLASPSFVIQNLIHFHFSDKLFEKLIHTFDFMDK